MRVVLKWAVESEPLTQRSFLKSTSDKACMHRKGKRGDPCWEKGTGRGDYCKAMAKGLHMKEALLGKRKRKRGLVEHEGERIAYKGAVYLCSHDTLHVG